MLKDQIFLFVLTSNIFNINISLFAKINNSNKVNEVKYRTPIIYNINCRFININVML